MNVTRFTWLALMLGSYLSAWSQVNVVGRVTTADDNTPLPGVNIVEKGTTNGVITDAAGNYSIVVSENAVLVFSFIGFDTQEIAVEARSTINVVLSGNVMALREIVVIGFGEQDKKDLTGAVTVMNTEDFNKGVTTNPQDLLLGKMAGVSITTNGGAPGTSSTIRIRGGSSISATSDPLIVIDGFPVSNNSIPGLDNPLATINPNDIESVTVLKDASATAIFGLRASNGVIIITTKKGAAGEPSLTYDGQVSLSLPMRSVDVLDGDEFRALVQELHDKDLAGITDESLLRLGTANTDWQHEIYRPAFTHNHNLSLIGTYKQLPYRISYGYTDQQGILKTTDMKRHTLDISGNRSFLNNSLKVTVNAKGSYGNTSFGNTAAVGSAVSFDPSQPVFNNNGRYGGYFAWADIEENLPDGSMNPNGSPNTFATNNPVALLDLTDNQSTVKRLVGNVALDYKIPFLPELHINVNAGIDHSGSKGFNNTSPEAPWTYRNFDTGNGQLINYRGFNRSELLDVYGNYKRELANHSIELTAGYSRQHFEWGNATFNRNGDASVVIDSSELAYVNYLISFFGRLVYKYKDKYILTASLRDDMSSRYAPANRAALFPSVAAAWRLKDEIFLQNSRVISELKLRAGYGITGQQDLGNNTHPYLAVYRRSINGASYQFGDQYVPTLRPDPYDINIKWETTSTLNAGVDFGFFGGRLSGAVEVYQRNTKDLLNLIPIPAGTNFSNYLITNVGNMENKGIELTLNSVVLAHGPITWNVGLNLTHNQNKITRLLKTDDPHYEGILVGNISGGVGNTAQIHSVGYPAFSFYTFEQVYNTNQKPIEGLYVDRSGEGGVVTSNSRNKYHNRSSAPSLLVGLNTNLKYKQFDFSFSSRMSLGNYVYNNVASGASYSSVYVQSGYFGNVPRSIYDTSFENPQYWSDHYVENASFYKMDNISLGYSFDRLFTSKVKGHLGVTVQNAFMITNYSGIDPELPNGIDNNIYPRPRTFLLGISLTY